MRLLPTRGYPPRIFDEVSSFGRVKSLNGRWDKTPRIMKLRIKAGYLQVGFHKGGNVKYFLVHRLVAQAFIPNPESKPQVNHIDGDKLNNHMSNLEWCTQSENQNHAYDTGLQVAQQGEDSRDAKLTNEQARYVRNNPQRLNTVELGKMFGVDPQTISDIQLGRTYRNAGGVIRNKIDTRIPDDVRDQIRAEYVFGSREFSSRALARKYNVSQRTIRNIVREG